MVLFRKAWWKLLLGLRVIRVWPTHTQCAICLRNGYQSTILHRFPPIFQHKILFRKSCVIAAWSCFLFEPPPLSSLLLLSRCLVVKFTASPSPKAMRFFASHAIVTQCVHALLNTVFMPLGCLRSKERATFRIPRASSFWLSSCTGLKRNSSPCF